MIFISPGNIKLGKMHNFSIPPIVTCPNHEFCVQPKLGLKCYALDAYQRWKTVKKAWDMNLKLLNTSLPLFEDLANYHLDEYNPKHFRIHVGGDFMNQSYLNSWKRIIRRNSETKFLVFTKSYNLDFKGIGDNAFVYFSIMPNMVKIPKLGRRAYCGEPHHVRKREVIIECNGRCDGCYECFELPEDASVRFKIH